MSGSYGKGALRELKRREVNKFEIDFWRNITLERNSAQIKSFQQKTNVHEADGQLQFLDKA